jgi:hypothetical protein
VRGAKSGRDALSYTSRDRHRAGRWPAASLPGTQAGVFVVFVVLVVFVVFFVIVLSVVSVVTSFRFADSRGHIRQAMQAGTS